MRSFWFEFDGERIEIVFKLIKNGRWRTNYKNPNMRILDFDYQSAEEIIGDSTISIADFELEDLDPQVLSMLFQSLKMDAPEFGLAYS